MGKKIDVPQEVKQQIISLYNSGLSVHAVGKRIGRTGDFVHSRLVEWGVPRRNAAHIRKYSIDHNAFSAMNEYSSYFAGLIMSDGYVHRRPNNKTQMVIGLCSKDKDVLDEFRKFVKTKRPIYDGKDGTFSVSFTSNRIADDLNKVWGITERKSKTATISDPLIAYNRHFWRGMIDGDGHVGGEKRKCIYFCSASDGTATVYINLLNSLGIAAKNYKRKDGFNNIYTGGSDAIRLAKFLYDDASVYMNRKKLAAKLMINKYKGGDAHE